MKWIKMGWGENYSQIFNEKIPLTFDCTNAIISSKPVLDIGINCIHKITKEYPGPYTLMASGGVDTQAMLYLWKLSGVPFNTVSFTYNDTYNQHDLITLQEFANKNDIKINYINFDMISFLENTLPEYAHKYQCTSPQICAHMRMSEEITEGTVIYSGNFIFPTTCSLDYTMLGLYRYAQISCRNLIPFFFQHDAELAPALIPVQKLLPERGIKSKSSEIGYEDKVEMYKIAGFPIIGQQSKLSGFEVIKDYYDTLPNLVSAADRVEFSKKPSKRAFDIHFRYKFTRTIKYVDTLNYIFGS